MSKKSKKNKSNKASGSDASANAGGSKASRNNGEPDDESAELVERKPSTLEYALISFAVLFVAGGSIVTLLAGSTPPPDAVSQSQLVETLSHTQQEVVFRFIAWGIASGLVGALFTWAFLFATTRGGKR